MCKCSNETASLGPDVSKGAAPPEFHWLLLLDLPFLLIYVLGATLFTLLYLYGR